MIRSAVLIAGIALMGLALAGCFHDMTPDNQQPSTEDALKISQQAPSQATPNDAFTVAVTVEATQSLPAVSIRADFDGLTLVDKGDFVNVEGNVVKGVMLQPTAGQSETFEFQLECTESIEYAITAIAQSKDITPVWNTANVQCGSGS